MKVGIGYANDPNAAAAGKQVVERALQSGGIKRADLIIAFCSGRLDPDAYFNGLRSATANQVPIVGGSAIGIITNTVISYEGFPAGAVVIESNDLSCRIAAAGGVDLDEMTAGRQLAEKLSDAAGANLLLIFYDSIKAPPTATTPPIINASPRLIEGIEKGLTSDVPIVGAGVIGDYEFSQTRQFCGSFVGAQHVAGALLKGNFQVHFRIMHGCIPKDGTYYRITRAEGPILFELDDRPIVDIIDEQYGNQHWRHQFPVKRLTIAVNHGEKYGDFDENNFVNRLISGVLPDGSGVLLFEPDLKKGDEVLFMLRNNKVMHDSARKISIELLEEVRAAGRQPACALYIDCAGRTATVSDTRTEEAAEVQAACNRYGLPLLGFYSGVEIAPLLGKSRGLDWTGVFIVLSTE